MHLMLWPRRHSFWRSLPRRMFALLAAAAYLTATLGVPLPAWGAKDRSQPYPCQDHPCGCQNAEECWRHCGCYTPAERFAWAAAHGIEPPDYAERPEPDQEQASAHACPACCHHGAEVDTTPRKSCCAGHEDSDDPSPSHSHWVAGVAARHCHGLSTLWVALGAVVAPPPFFTWAPWWPAAGWLSPPDRTLPGQGSHPPDPPPRGLLPQEIGLH
jgi:hypothetical protein